MTRQGSKRFVASPLPSEEYGRYKTVKARLSGKCPLNVSVEISSRSAFLDQSDEGGEQGVSGQSAAERRRKN